MPLTGKYLKYTPEITFEIFQKIWDKLLENGWKSKNGDVEYQFNFFKEGRFLRECSDKNNFFYVFTIKNKHIETV